MPMSPAREGNQMPQRTLELMKVSYGCVVSARIELQGERWTTHCWCCVQSVKVMGLRISEDIRNG